MGSPKLVKEMRLKSELSQFEPMHTQSVVNLGKLYVATIAKRVHFCPGIKILRCGTKKFWVYVYVSIPYNFYALF